MKYIKSIFEDARPAPKPNLLRYLVPMTKVARGEQDIDELDTEAQQGVTALMTWIANAIFTRLYIEPKTYSKVKLFGVEHVDGPTDLTEWAADYADGEATSANVDIDTNYLIAMEDTGNAEYDALFPDEKYIEIGLLVNMELTFTYRRYDDGEWEIDETEASVHHCMIAGIWDVELKPDVVAAIEKSFDDVPNRKWLMKRGD